MATTKMTKTTKKKVNIAAPYDLVRTPGRSIRKKAEGADEYLGGFRVDAILLLLYLLTRTKNEKKNMVEFRTRDYLKFYEVANAPGSRYRDVVGALLLLQAGIPVFDGKVWARIFPIYKTAPVYSARVIEQAFSANDRILSELGFSDKERTRMSKDLRNNGMRLWRRPAPALPLEVTEYGKSLQSGGTETADDPGSKLLFGTNLSRIGDEFGFFETDDAGNHQPDLYGEGPKRIRAKGYRVTFSDNFIKELAENKFPLLWLPKEYGVALMKNKHSKYTVRLILELALMLSEMAKDGNWEFRRTAYDLHKIMAIETKKPKKVREAIVDGFKACHKAGLIKSLPVIEEAPDREPENAIYHLRRDKITGAKSSRNRGPKFEKQGAKVRETGVPSD